MLPSRTLSRSPLHGLVLLLSLHLLAAGELEQRAMRLLHQNCLGCHNEEKQKGGLQLTSRELASRGGDSGSVLSDDPEQSLLLKVLAADADPHMPPKKQLPPDQIEVIRRWIAAGANWDEEAMVSAAQAREVTFESIPAGYQPVMAMALTADGNRLAFGRGNRIWLHDVSATNFPLIAEAEAHPDIVRSLAWNSDGTLLASGSFREISLWSGDNLARKWTVSSNVADRVMAIRFTPFGGALIIADSPAGGGGWVRILAPETGEVLAEWEAHADSINDLALSPDGGLLATAGNDKVAKLWDLVSRSEVAQYEGHTGALLGAAFNTNATELVTISTDNHLRVWDVRSRHSVVTIGPKPETYNAVAWSADGVSVIAAHEKGHIIRFTEFNRHTGEQSVATAREKKVVSWASPFYSLALNADASRIFAGSEDGKVRVVDGEGKPLHTFEPDAKAAVPPATAPSFVRDVLPMLAKAGCSAGSCHAKPDGQNGFSLSVFSYDPKADFEEIVKEAKGRRIFPAAPAESLILLKPTMAVEHGGGRRVEPGSATYEKIVEWVRGGMVYQHANEPVLERVTVEPAEGTYTAGQSQPLKVTAFYSDGSDRDVTGLAEYVSNEKEIASVDEQGNVTVGQVTGEGVIVARYMGFVDAARVIVPPQKVFPAERYAKLPAHNYVDRMAAENFEKLGLFPSDICSDSEFIRRSSLDAIGVLPTSEQTRKFLADTDPGKRRKWVEELLQHPAYGDYWANKWADLLRPNPDRVGIKSVYMLDQWLRAAFRANKPYDQFVREILLAEGSNHTDGPVVVYRDRRDPPELTTMFSQLFLGVRMECAKCHHHPNEKWSQDDFYQLAAFFGGVKQKGAGLSPPISAGTETFYFASGGSVKHPVTEAIMKPKALDGHAPAAEEDGADPRTALADWMTNPDNPYFARAAVNRVWANFFGRGFVEPVDDFRVSNPAVHEPLLNALAEDFAAQGYDFKHLMRTIMNSRLYQLSSSPTEQNLSDTKNFSRGYRRRISAEVLLDAIDDITGIRKDFAGCPPGTRAIQTWSYKIDSHFMDAFGRPNASSDAPCERNSHTSMVQSLHMMNSKELQEKLAHSDGKVTKLVQSERSNEQIIEELYLSCFCRFPTEEEKSLALAAYSAPGATRQTASEDVLWALLNSAEFVFNH